MWFLWWGDWLWEYDIEDGSYVVDPYSDDELC
jgi:hypothetical protein